MSDTRFTLLGIGLIFAGFLILSIFGGQFTTSTIESKEFGDCYEYHEDAAPTPINCDYKTFDKTVLFGAVIALIAGGAAPLIKGVRGKWDQKVRPEDMLGPGADRFKEDEDSETKD